MNIYDLSGIGEHMLENLFWLLPNGNSWCVVSGGKLLAHTHSLPAAYDAAKKFVII